MERAWWIWHMRLAVFAALGSGCDSKEVPDGDRRDQGPFSTECENAVVLRNAAGEPTGYVRCEGGGLNRVGPAACDGAPRGQACASSSAGGGRRFCELDSDCTAEPHGKCIRTPGESLDDCNCRYGCSTDADCEADAVCVCDAEGARCVEARCRSGEDCDSGACGAGEYSDDCDPQYTILMCRTAYDGCRTLDDCSGGYGTCGPTDKEDGEFQCVDGPVCGRPLRADDTPVLAPITARHDWAEPAALTTLHLLNASDRAALAKHWEALAALEHASVASFARFTLQLMALGAPAELVAAAEQAGLDEVRHARLCYGVAGALGGAAVGPAALDLRGVTLDFDPATVLREVVREACVGETLGAAEAFAQAERPLDPHLEALWRTVAEDELRHAALGWATLRWLLQTHPKLTLVATEAFADAARRLADAGSSTVRSGPHLPGFGLLGAPASARLYAETLRVVVAPAAVVLLAQAQQAVQGDDGCV